VSVERNVRKQIELLVVDPSRAAVLFWVSGAFAALAAIPTARFSHHNLLVLFVTALFCALAAGARAARVDEWPGWTIYLDIGAAIVLVSVLTYVAAGSNQNFAALYLWVALYNALYFRPLHAFVVLALEGVAYALVLIYGPTIASPVTAWFIVMATGAVICGVVLTLVGELTRMSREDPLTLLPNRRVWDARIDEELERARRSGTALSVVMIDIDDFKSINDLQGHAEGDRVLRELAENWRQSVRTGGDFIARLGGDEFGLLSPHSDLGEIATVVARLRLASPPGVSCSFGHATWDGHETAASLFRRADESMYEAKRHNR
jgi:diguanylate cyclase (GGDEF)-like protein